MNATIPVAGYDFNRTCPQAGFNHFPYGRREYGIPGLDICARVEKNIPASSYYPWRYCIFCRVSQHHTRGRTQTRGTALQKMLFWLRQVNCPGKLP